MSAGGALLPACFLRNSRLKSVPSACGKGASSLRPKVRSVILPLRRRGASPWSCFPDVGSRRVRTQVTEFVLRWVGRVVREGPEAGSKGKFQSVPVALDGYGTL